MSEIAQRVVCATCGSDDVARDAWAGWDMNSQSWRLTAVFDYAHRQACEGETTLQTQEICLSAPSEAAV